MAKHWTLCKTGQSTLMATLLNCTEPKVMFKMILAGIGFVSEWIFPTEQVGGRGEVKKGFNYDQYKFRRLNEYF